jgi:AAA15 family ATPase/GTPase
MAEQLKINRLRIKDFAGIEQYTIDFGQLTMIEGDNGMGKSSVTNALAAIFDGGNPTHLIRNGSERSEIALELSNGIVFNKQLVRGGKAVLKETHPEYGTVNAAQTHLNKLHDAFSVNPARLMECKPEERVKYFLNALPIELAPEALDDIAPRGFEIPTGHPLKVLPAVRKELETRRRGKRIQYEDKQSSISQLRQSLPAIDGESIVERLASTRKKLSDTRDQLDNAENAVRLRVGNEIQDLLEERSAFIASGESELNARIQQMRKEWDDKKQEYQDSYEVQTNGLSQQKDQGIEQARAIYQPEIDELSSEIAKLEQRTEEEIRIKHTRELVTKYETEESTLRQQWEDLNARVKKLDELDSSLTADLPIPGLVIQNEEIYFENVPWPQLNTAKQIELAFQVAVLRAKDLGVIFFDGLEHLSPKNLEIFKEFALKSDRQIFTTRVTDGPLTIKTYPSKVAEAEQAIAA